MADQAQHHQQAQNSPLRPAMDVMRLDRMGSFFPTRLSFMRSLIRTLATEKAKVKRTHWVMSDDGFGYGVYEISLSGHTYSLVAISNNIPADKRTDRVIAEMWDSAYVLYDGAPSQAEIDRLVASAPKQEAARFTENDLILSRANKSLRLFNHVVDCLSEGQQPNLEMVKSIGYLMRTTAVYGNGKFGISDRARIADREGMAHPFRLEMLTVWLIRAFTHDLAEYMAEKRAPTKAIKLAPNIKRYLGIGNSTGLGMAPFLVNHPNLLNNWMMVRETALARILDQEGATEENITKANHLAQRATRHLQEWSVDDMRQMARIETLRDEFPDIEDAIASGILKGSHPWQKLYAKSQAYSLECQELVVALILEIHGDLIDGLAECMGSTYEPKLNPLMTIEEIIKLIQTHAQWALDIDFSKHNETHQFWYVSEEKLEPRLGNRHEEDGADREQPLDIARQIQAFYGALSHAKPSLLLGEFLLANAQHREIAKRLQALPQFPYSEIQDNLIGKQCLPIDMLRCKLSFFGASKFDPRSDRWTRITLFQGAPLINELGPDADDWWLPILSTNFEAAE